MARWAEFRRSGIGPPQAEKAETIAAMDVHRVNRIHASVSSTVLPARRKEVRRWERGICEDLCEKARGAGGGSCSHGARNREGGANRARVCARPMCFKVTLAYAETFQKDMYTRTGETWVACQGFH